MCIVPAKLAVDLCSLHNFGDDSTNVRKVFGVCIRAPTCDDQVGVIWVAYDNRLLVAGDPIPRVIKQSIRVLQRNLHPPIGPYRFYSCAFQAREPCSYPILSFQHRFDGQVRLGDILWLR